MPILWEAAFDGAASDEIEESELAADEEVPSPFEHAARALHTIMATRASDIIFFIFLIFPFFSQAPCNPEGICPAAEGMPFPACIFLNRQIQELLYQGGKFFSSEKCAL